MAVTRNDDNAAPDRRPKELTAKQRARQQRSGAEAAKMMRLAGTEPTEAEKKTIIHTHKPQPTNFSSTAELLGGPKNPPKITQGVRRYGDKDSDNVGYMLTDDFFSSGADEPKKNRNIPKDCVSNSCKVMVEEAPFRPGLRMTDDHGAPMDAPYFEDNDPKGPREMPDPEGVRFFPNKSCANNNIMHPECDADPYHLRKEPVPSFKKGKANESVNVTNLKVYSRAQLNEPEEPNRQWGPRKFVAPGIYPRRRPAIRQMNCDAKAEHDVLGNGRFGKPEQVKPVGVAKPDIAPPKDTAHDVVFHRLAPPQQEPTRKPKNDLLRYYDPAVDGPVEKKCMRATKNNVESKDVPARATCKANGVYKQKNGTASNW